MRKHGCTKVELNDAKYSSPVPVIGLYIAAASLILTIALGGFDTSFRLFALYSHSSYYLDGTRQMFVDMMHMFLARFPHAVFKEVTDSPAKEFDERIGLALHFVCQLKWLKAPIRWSFPAGCDISSLVDDQVHNAQNQVDSIEEPTTVENSISLHVTENVDNAFHITVDDEIVRVE